MTQSIVYLGKCYDVLVHLERMCTWLFWIECPINID